ncbi:MAG: B12-binding domain-containing radical SAM protein [Dehalococcoidia bacterium]
MSFQRPNIIRPPSEWKSYYLPVTSGCSNNTCTFCTYYYGSKLQMRDVEDVKAEIDALALYLRNGVRTPGVHPIVYELAPYMESKRVFLQDADALVYPHEKMVEVLQYLNYKFPDLERVAAYATPQDLLRRSVDQLKALRDLKLDILYVGFESGDDDVLQHVQKNATHDEIVEAAKKPKAAGITLSATVILGLAGVEGSEKHARETARLLNETDPEFAAALTLTLTPGTPLYEEMQEGKFQLITPFQSLQELRTMVEHLELTDCFFSSMHASNYISIRGRLPHEKSKMLREIDEILQKKDPALLRPEFLRGL